jgi:hypothetical protein
MKRLKLLGMTLAAACVMGLMATSAFALPDISVTLGGAYPLHLNYELIGFSGPRGKLEGTSGSLLESTGLKVLYLIGELTALGTFRAIFFELANGANTSEKCLNTANAGEVLTEGSFHIVYTSLSPLTLGTLYLVNELEIKCPTAGIGIKVKGSVIGAIKSPGASNAEQLTGLKNIITGSAGKQQFRNYYNDSGTSVLAQLLCNISGTGFKECNQVVAGEPEATALEGKMFVLSAR